MIWGIFYRFNRFILFGVIILSFGFNLKAETYFQPVLTYKTECLFNFITDSYCQITIQKPWSDSDVIKFEDAMEPLNKLEKFLNRVSDNGFTIFNRATYGILMDPFLVNATGDSKVQGWVEQNNRNINFPDKFFLNEDVDPLSGVSIRKLTLLHELAHAFDKDHEISNSAEFIKVAEWSIGDPFSKQAGIEYFDFLDYVNKAIESEGATNNPSEAFRIDRSLSTQLYKTTRTYSLTSPSEHFADLVAYIFYDSNSKNYLKPKLYSWILKNVLDNQTNY